MLWGAAGYRPVQVGRMHFVGYDQLHGFAERYVGDHVSNYFGGPDPCDHGMLRGADGPSRTGLKKSGYGQSSYQILDETVAAATWTTSTGLASGDGEDSTRSRSPYPLDSCSRTRRSWRVRRTTTRTSKGAHAQGPRAILRQAPSILPVVAKRTNTVDVPTTRSCAPAPRTGVS